MAFTFVAWGIISSALFIMERMGKAMDKMDQVSLEEDTVESPTQRRGSKHSTCAE